jgi:hypothetical protein
MMDAKSPHCLWQGEHFVRMLISFERNLFPSMVDGGGAVW